MNKKEIKHFVERLESEGVSHEEAIKQIAILLEKEIPKDLELYYQQKICGE